MQLWMLASLLANVCIIATEYLNHTATDGWRSVLLFTAPLIVAAQWGLFVTYNGAPSLYHAWIVFTLGNAGMRVAMVAGGLGGQVSSWVTVGLGISVMLGGAMLLKRGLA